MSATKNLRQIFLFFNRIKDVAVSSLKKPEGKVASLGRVGYCG